MAQPRKPTEESAEKPDEQPPPVEPRSKTMQELERLQFDALDRAGFDRR
jgi:hypothetical protein